MSNSIYDECVTVASSLTENLLFYFQENSENIEEWRESFLDATASLINEIADETIQDLERENFRRYLVVKCTPLSDQYETDCDRVPIGVTDNWKKYINSYPYIEVWEVKGSGNLELIKNWDDDSLF